MEIKHQQGEEGSTERGANDLGGSLAPRSLVYCVIPQDSELNDLRVTIEALKRQSGLAITDPTIISPTASRRHTSPAMVPKDLHSGGSAYLFYGLCRESRMTVMDILLHRQADRQTHAHTNTCMHACTHTHTHTHMRAHACMHTCMHTYAPHTETQTDSDGHTLTHTHTDAHTHLSLIHI